MVFSPFRSAISHCPREKPTAEDPFDITHRPRGSRRPRAPDRVPRWRARRNLRRRTLAARIDTLAERRVAALEAAPGIDLAGLRGALELLKLGPLPARPHPGRHRTAELPSELDEPQARARVIA